MRAGNSICFLGKRTWGNFLKKVSRPLQKLSIWDKMDIVCAIPVRPMKLVKLQVCKTSSFTNDQKAYCDFVTSAQWDVCPDFLCNKGNAVAVRFFAYLLTKPQRLCYTIFIFIFPIASMGWSTRGSRVQRAVGWCEIAAAFVEVIPEPLFRNSFSAVRCLCARG